MMHLTYIGSVTNTVKNSSTVKKGFTNPMIGVSQATKSISQVHMWYKYICMYMHMYYVSTKNPVVYFLPSTPGIYFQQFSLTPGRICV